MHLPLRKRVCSCLNRTKAFLPYCLPFPLRENENACPCKTSSEKMACQGWGACFKDCLPKLGTINLGHRVVLFPLPALMMESRSASFSGA